MAASWSFRQLAVFCLLILIGHALAYDPQYCSDENTATTAQNSSIFQSSGLCHDFCQNNYAFAVLQEHDCWCTNYAPDSTTSLSDCTYTCPGYPDDNCGGPGLFAYIPLNKAPLGVKGAGGGPAGVTTASGQISIKTSTTSTTDTTPSSSSSATWTPTPITSLETVTGQVRTVTVTPTSPPSTSQNLGATSESTSKGGGRGRLTTGGAVGLTVGLVALVVAICAIIYFCVRKRKGAQTEEFDKDVSRRGSSSGVLNGPVPQRTMSENSRYLLNTDGQRVVETWEDRDVSGSRRSRLMPVDPRLNPFAPVYQRGENKSRESVNTIRDDHDYSRRVHQQGPILRATNPDEL